MEDYHRYIFRVLYKFIYGDVECLRGQVVGSFDVATAVVIVPDIDDEIIFAWLFVTLYYLRQFLLSVAII